MHERLELLPLRRDHLEVAPPRLDAEDADLPPRPRLELHRLLRRAELGLNRVVELAVFARRLRRRRRRAKPLWDTGRVNLPEMAGVVDGNVADQYHLPVRCSGRGTGGGGGGKIGGGDGGYELRLQAAAVAGGERRAQPGAQMSGIDDRVLERHPLGARTVHRVEQRERMQPTEAEAAVSGKVVRLQLLVDDGPQRDAFWHEHVPTVSHQLERQRLRRRRSIPHLLPPRAPGGGHGHLWLGQLAWAEGED
jgi:hypothetical protein